MPPVNTRECTEVFTGPITESIPVRFAQRFVERVDRFEQRVFSSDERHEGDSVLASLTQRLEEENRRKSEEKKSKKTQQKAAQESRKEKVNKKRAFIARVIRH